MTVISAVMTDMGFVVWNKSAMMKDMSALMIVIS